MGVHVWACGRSHGFDFAWPGVSARIDRLRFSTLCAGLRAQSRHRRRSGKAAKAARRRHRYRARGQLADAARSDSPAGLLSVHASVCCLARCCTHYRWHTRVVWLDWTTYCLLGTLITCQRPWRDWSRLYCRQLHCPEVLMGGRAAGRSCPLARPCPDDTPSQHTSVERLCRRMTLRPLAILTYNGMVRHSIRTLPQALRPAQATAQ